tara:strand:+ start:12184 stop:13848 length:1665 start_codon:yes stop_codon:yes gene_type:complete
MKKLKISSPFFCFAFGLICLLNSDSLYSQNKTDSSTYYYYKIINPESNSDLITAYNFYNQHKNTSLQKKDTLRAIYDLQMMAESQIELGLSYESSVSAIEALELLDNFKRNDTLIQTRYKILIHLGVVYNHSGAYEKAIETYQNGLKIVKTQKDSITFINNIANCYFEMKAYDLALDQFNLIYKKTIKNSDPLQKAMVLNNLGAVQSKLDHPDALYNLKQSIYIRKEEKDITKIYLTYKNLFHYYNDRNEKEIAQAYADSAYEAVKKINIGTQIHDVLALNLELNEDPKIIEYKRLTDSIYKADQLRKNEYSFNKYRYDKQEKIAIANELQKEKEKRLKLIYQVVAGFIFLLLIAAYFILKARNKREKVEEVYKTETRISKKVHDEVANEVYHVMTKLQIEESQHEEILDDLENIYSKTRDISKENSLIDFDQNFNELLNDLLISYKTNQVKVITRNLLNIDWKTKAEYKKATLYRVLQELMTNMRKHSKASLVVLTFEEDNHKVNINYSDNGMGCDLKKQVGLQNAENRMQTSGGSIIFETEMNKGFKVKITI